ncbi:hypothetical protein, partial [Epilithonimonas sp.]|uniref:hypothetical protein n=1 Tax=Epilithonimonas sp. TaxID=2894511 RepID=UPI00390C442A
GGIGVGAMTVFGVAFNKTEIHKKETVAVEKIDEIEIKTSAADVEIITVDSKDIEVLLDGEISKELVDEYKFDVKKENNRLNIKFSKNQNLDWLRITKREHQLWWLTFLTVPFYL